ncbi:hypothetical protein HGB25_00630 [Candidatus Saccharibacteria bacterium]|nr:hypothetical protein [Candidatus Saccharibacteria bacterium]
MVPSKNINALKTLHDKLSDVDWRLIGSMNLALQGVDIEAKDIDVRINVEDIQTVQSALKDYCKKQIEYGQNDGYSSFFGQFNIEGVQVDVIAGIVEKDGFKTTDDLLAIKPIVIEVYGISIPCVDLKTEYDAYISLGRKEKAVLIKSVIENNSK